MQADDVVRVRDIWETQGAVTLDIADSANLYITERQGLLYERAVSTHSYYKHVRASISRCERLLPALWKSFDVRPGYPTIVLDCGPGTSDESASRYKYWSSSISMKKYFIIDMNRRVLDRAQTSISSPAGTSPEMIQSRFEDLNREEIVGFARCRCIYLFGSTLMNFEEPNALTLLRRLCQPGDGIAFVTMTREASAPLRLQMEAYCSPEVEDFVFEPLRLIGGKRVDFSAFIRPGQDRVEFCFRALRECNLRIPNELHLHRGDLVLTGFSRRPTAIEHLTTCESWFRLHESVEVGNGLILTVACI